jgi:hypothetical protein
MMSLERNWKSRQYSMEDYAPFVIQKELPSARKCLEEEMRQMRRSVNWTMIQKKGGAKKGKENEANKRVGELRT